MERERDLPTPARLPMGGAAHAWHLAINQHVHPRGGLSNYDDARFMYEAKTAADEVGRLAYLFRMERDDKLPKVHRQCSHDTEGTPVADNHLTCCLGVECRACPFLLALDTAEMRREDIDIAKAWTCVTHIVQSGGDAAREGYVLTVDDQMYWSNVYASMAMTEDDTSGGDDAT